MPASIAWLINCREGIAFLLLSLLVAVSATACNTGQAPIPGAAATHELPVESSPAADNVSVPSDRVERIQIEDLKTMMDSGQNVVILDVREVEYYRLGHISGAISFPWKPSLTETDLEMLPHGDIIVTYCQCGPGEADSADIAWQLIQLGFDNVKTLAHPSIQGWTASGFPNEPTK